MTTHSRTMAPTVAQAIEELRQALAEHAIVVREDGEGGAFVIVEGLDPGDTYQQRETWVGFRLTFQYPYADVYPHYVRGDLARVDGRALGGGTGKAQFEGRSAVQLSRRSNRLNPGTDTALLKLMKVMEWLRAHSGAGPGH